MGILGLQERVRSKLFVRRDRYGRFYSALVYVPRDRFSTQVRHRIEAMLREALGGERVDTNVQIGDSPLAQLHIIVRPKRQRGQRRDRPAGAGGQARGDRARLARRPARAAGGPPWRRGRAQARRALRQRPAGGLHRGGQPGSRGRRRRAPGRAGRRRRPAPAAVPFAARQPALQAVPPAARHPAVRRAADDGEHGPARHHRASVQGRCRRPPGVDPGLRGRVPAGRARRRCAGREFRGGVRPDLARRRRERRLQPAGAGRRPVVEAGRDAARVLQVPAADRRAVLAGLRGGHADPLPAAGAAAGGTVRGPLRSGHRQGEHRRDQAGHGALRRPAEGAGRRRCRRAERAEGAGQVARRQPRGAGRSRARHAAWACWTASPAWTRTASCAASSASSTPPCAPTTTSNTRTACARTAARPTTWRSSSTPPRCRTCRSRVRTARSGCAARAWKASTCASARWRAAACAGRIAARTSAPKCWAW